MSIREEDVSRLPVCPGCGTKANVRRYDVGDGPANGDAPLEACFCDRCSKWCSQISSETLEKSGESVADDVSFR